MGMGALWREAPRAHRDVFEVLRRAVSLGTSGEYTIYWASLLTLSVFGLPLGGMLQYASSKLEANLHTSNVLTLCPSQRYVAVKESRAGTRIPAEPGDMRM